MVIARCRLRNLSGKSRGEDGPGGISSKTSPFLMRTASFALIFALLQSLPVRGAPLTRDAAILEAVTKNPELGVAMIEIARAKSRLRWAGKLDNPELELSGSTDQLGANEGESTAEIALSQRFPITSRLRDEKNVRR